MTHPHDGTNRRIGGECLDRRPGISASSRPNQTTAFQEWPGMPSPDDDPLPQEVALVEGAAAAGLSLRLRGGLGVRVLCPDFPPRLRAGQDMDLACASKGRRDVAAYLERSGCVPDKMFNNLNGDRQMYFIAPSGRPIDVMVDRLGMCHTLEFRSSLGTSSLTLDPADLLLSKLQIFELNAKDVHDITHLLAGLPVGDRSSGAFIDVARFRAVVAADWGWWRTTTGSLEKLPALLAASPGLVPANARYDPLAQATLLLYAAASAPKSMKWKLRANVGDRVRWYELPEEVAH